MAKTTFDYTQAPAELRNLTHEIRDHMKASTRGIVEIGNRLLEVKAMLAHGKFRDWLGAEFGLSERTAQNMMAAAAYCKSAKFADLEVPASALYLLAADTTPEDVRDRFTSRIQAGESVTHKEVAAAVQRVKVRRVQPALPREAAMLAADGGAAEVVADAKTVTAAVEPAQLANPDQLDRHPELRAADGTFPGQESSKQVIKTNPEQPTSHLASPLAPIDVVTVAINHITAALADLPNLIEVVPATHRSGFNVAVEQMLQPAEAIRQLVQGGNTPRTRSPKNGGRTERTVIAFMPTLEVRVAAWVKKCGGRVTWEESSSDEAVVQVSFAHTKVTDTDIEPLKELCHLQTLDVYGTKVTDVGLEHLAPCKELKRVVVTRTKVTDQGVRKLQEALPDCKIER